MSDQLLAFSAACLTLWAHKFVIPTEWEGSITWSEETRVQVLALTLALWPWEKNLPSLCLVSSFHDEDFGLHFQLSAAETSSPTHLWIYPFVVGCCLPALIWALPAGSPSSCPHSRPLAASISLGSPVSIRGLPPHSTGFASWIIPLGLFTKWGVDHVSLSFLVSIYNWPWFNSQILAVCLLPFYNYFHAPLGS